MAPPAQAAELTDDAVVQLRALGPALGAVTAKASAQMVPQLASQVETLVPVMSENVAAMLACQGSKNALKPGQVKALQDFAAAVHAIAEGLRPGSSPPLSPAAAAVAAAPRPLFPPGCGCGPASPEAFYRVREALAGALKALGPAVKPSYPGLARALKGAIGELEEVGLFD